jgi:hypothetical protein
MGKTRMQRGFWWGTGWKVAMWKMSTGCVGRPVLYTMDRFVYSSITNSCKVRAILEPFTTSLPNQFWDRSVIPNLIENCPIVSRMKHVDRQDLPLFVPFVYLVETLDTSRE